VKSLKLACLTVGLLAAAPVFAQTAGNTPNTGPQGTGNFVAGRPEGQGTSFVAGRPEGQGTSFVKAKKKQRKGNMARGKAR
jgi:hypothetical protein